MTKTLTPRTPRTPPRFMKWLLFPGSKRFTEILNPFHSNYGMPLSLWFDIERERTNTLDLLGHMLLYSLRWDFAHKQTKWGNQRWVTLKLIRSCPLHVLPAVIPTVDWPSRVQRFGSITITINISIIIEISGCYIESVEQVMQRARSEAIFLRHADGKHLVV